MNPPASSPPPQRELDPRLVLKGLPPKAHARRPAARRVLSPTRILTTHGEVIDLRTAEEISRRPDQRPDLRPATSAMASRSPAQRALGAAASGLPLAAVLAIAAFLRFWQLGQVGYNSDEAVYAGTAASMAGHTDYTGMFPVFRAHPLLFQTFLSLLYHPGVSDWVGRALAAVVGIATVGVTYAVGRRLYGPLCGTVAGLLLAVMPYHVIVSRQVLLDGPMTLFATLTLYCLVRYCEEPNWRWMLAAGGTLGLTVLSKETGGILVGSIYAFFALTPAIRLRIRHLVAGAALLAAFAAVFPVVVRVSGHTSSRQSYLLWQLGRRGNHPMFFYADVIPHAVGVLTLLAALFGLIVLRRNPESWRERLLLAWMAVPVVFFTVWPLKGYQYLLPAAPALAVLAARGLVALYWLPALRAANRQRLRRITVSAAVLVTVAGLLVPAWALVNPSSSGTFLAGTGGVPGGREAGRWLRTNAPADTQLLSIGPSMANILQFYGGHRAFGLSVSSNPRDRNPAYQPVANPDLWVRDGRVQYVVWDSYTANRTPFFAAKITGLAKRYHGVAVFTATVPVRTPTGAHTRSPVVIVYEVRPA